MAQNKRKVSVSLDDDLVGELEATDVNLSAQVNEAIRLVVALRKRRQALGVLLDDLERLDGPVDEAEVQRFLELLS